MHPGLSLILAPGVLSQSTVLYALVVLSNKVLFILSLFESYLPIGYFCGHIWPGAHLRCMRLLPHFTRPLLVASLKLFSRM
jgi:hypothetical protein